MSFKKAKKVHLNPPLGPPWCLIWMRKCTRIYDTAMRQSVCIVVRLCHTTYAIWHVVFLTYLTYDTTRLYASIVLQVSTKLSKTTDLSETLIDKKIRNKKHLSVTLLVIVCQYDCDTYWQKNQELKIIYLSRNKYFKRSAKGKDYWQPCTKHEVFFNDISVMVI